jgi:hypothetical protein
MSLDRAANRASSRYLGFRHPKTVVQNIYLSSELQMNGLGLWTEVIRVSFSRVVCVRSGKNGGLT